MSHILKPSPRGSYGDAGAVALSPAGPDHVRAHEYTGPPNAPNGLGLGPWDPGTLGWKMFHLSSYIPIGHSQLKTWLEDGLQYDN